MFNIFSLKLFQGFAHKNKTKQNILAFSKDQLLKEYRGKEIQNVWEKENSNLI